VIDSTLAASHAFGETLARQGIPVDGVLHPAVPPGVGRRQRHPTPVVAFAGRLVAEKGADVAIRALARIVAQNSDVRLWIAGEGPQRPDLQSLGEELGVSENVDFLGYLPRLELERRLAGAWVQCVPSLWEEPFGLVAVEAQARGTVLVASAVGALPELVVEGRTGHLVPPGDPVALADAIFGVLADPQAADRLGDAARISTRNRFDGAAYADRIVDEFEDIRSD